MDNGAGKPLQDLIGEFLNWLSVEKGCPENTVVSYGYDLERYKDFINDECDGDIACVGRADIYDHIATLKDRDLSSRSRARHFAARLVAYVTGGAWLLFALASHGFSVVSLMEGLPFLAIIAAAFAGRWWPKVGGTIILLGGLAALWFFVLEAGRGIGQQYFVLLLLPLPLILSGILQLLPEGKDDAPVDETAEDPA